jgi:hypothetical protein
MQTVFGGRRIVDMLVGEQLPEFVKGWPSGATTA